MISLLWVSEWTRMFMNVLPLWAGKSILQNHVCEVFYGRNRQIGIFPGSTWELNVLAWGRNFPTKVFTSSQIRWHKYGSSARSVPFQRPGESKSRTQAHLILSHSALLCFPDTVLFTNRRFVATLRRARLPAPYFQQHFLTSRLCVSFWSFSRYFTLSHYYPTCYGDYDSLKAQLTLAKVAFGGNKVFFNQGMCVVLLDKMLLHTE